MGKRGMLTALLVMLGAALGVDNYQDKVTIENLSNATVEATYWKEKYDETQLPVIHVTATAYGFHGRQTANGSIVTKGHIAVSRDLKEQLLNEKIEVYDLSGDLIGTFVVTDTMASGIRNSVDIYMKRGHKEFGRQPVTIKVVRSLQGETGDEKDN